MNTLQRTLNSHVNIGEVYDERAPLEDQISKLWTELWWLSSEVAAVIRPSWPSIGYYESVLRSTYLRSQDTGYWLDVEAQSADRDLLMEALEEFCPPGLFFGPHPDMPHAWGFYPTCWRNEE